MILCRRDAVLRDRLGLAGHPGSQDSLNPHRGDDVVSGLKAFDRAVAPRSGDQSPGRKALVVVST